MAKCERSTVFTKEMLIYPWMRNTAKSAYAICWEKKKISCTRVPASSPKHFLPTVDTQHQTYFSIIFHAWKFCPLTPFSILPLLWPLLCKAHSKLSDIQGMSLHVLVKHPACPWVAVTQEKVFGLRTWLAGVVRAHAVCPKSCDSLPRHNGLP